MTPLQKLLNARMIDAEDFFAAVAFMSDVEPASGRSNTSAICETAARLSIDPAKLRLARKRHEAALNRSANGVADQMRNKFVADGVVGQMKCKDESGPVNDYAGALLRQVEAKKRYEQNLEKWQIRLLEDFLLQEHTVFAMAHRWGLGRKAMRTKILEVLKKLTQVQEQHHHAFQETLASYRQMAA